MLKWETPTHCQSSRSYVFKQIADWPDGGQVVLIHNRACRMWYVRYRAFGANVWGLTLVAEKTKKLALATAEQLASIQFQTIY